MMELFVQLGLALAAGLLIGIERGWTARERAEGSRLAGIRTFGLIGLLGGLWGLLAQQLGPVLLGLAFLGFGAVLVAAHIQEVRVYKDVGITTVTAALAVFALGALATQGYTRVVAPVAVVMAVLLSLKPMLHGWLRRLTSQEWYSTLKLLLISLVVLPVLPNRGFGPWQALNPYQIWWMVVLIAAISFVGYFAMKIAGPRRGTMLTGLFGGMASSTAVTLSFSRLAQKGGMQSVLAAGVLVSAATMFPRVLLEVAVVNPALLPDVVVPLIVMTVLAYAGGGWLWYQSRSQQLQEEPSIKNPFQIGPALQFGVLLAVIMFLSEALRTWFGDAGVYALAAASGVADVDAITLTMAKAAGSGLADAVAVRAIILAAAVNTLVKAGLVLGIAGFAMGLRVSVWSLLTLIGGAGALLFA